MYVAGSSSDTNTTSTHSNKIKRKAAQLNWYACDETKFIDVQKFHNNFNKKIQKVVIYKATIKNVVNVKANEKIESLIATQEETVKKLKRKQY